MKILHVVGARPNFMKVAPVDRALKNHGFEQRLVHTGQHYDANMSDVFFSQLGMPAPDWNLGVGSGSHARQTAEIMIRLEPVIIETNPGLVMVYGDVNSTMAATLVCAKLLVPVGHVEAGLRSFDRSMPEETNRIVTDRLADLLFTPSEDADENLQNEGIAPEKIHRVGNVMIDSLVHLLPMIKGVSSTDLPSRYVLVTLHRPSNVDDSEALRQIVRSLLEVSEGISVVFSVHPRTRRRLLECDIKIDRLHILEPMPYVEFLALQRGATAVITDSGGIQEETTYLGIPCLTLRDNTERPVTITKGTNTLIGRDAHRLTQELARICDGQKRASSIPPLWDGSAAERIAQILQKL